VQRLAVQKCESVDLLLVHVTPKVNMFRDFEEHMNRWCSHPLEFVTMLAQL
jgi:hypothetical protein